MCKRVDEYCITEMRIQTLSILKRSPSGERPSRIVRARISFERAYLKKRCFKSFSAVGRFTGSFTKQAATISLNDWKGYRWSVSGEYIKATSFKEVSIKWQKPLKISCPCDSQDQVVHFVRSSGIPAMDKKLNT
jgi:hypothetical protein